MTAGTCAACECDVGAGVDREAIVLVLDVRVADCDACAGADVECVCVVTALRVAVGVVDGDGVEQDVCAGGDGEGVDGCVLDV